MRQTMILTGEINLKTVTDPTVPFGRVASELGEADLGRQTLALLKRELEPLRSDSSPFSGRQPPKGTVFVEPKLVAAVEFREWTGSGTLRAPSGLLGACHHRPSIEP